jgi:hypothetical protein
VKAYRGSRVIGVRNENSSLEMYISAVGSKGNVNILIKPTGHSN